MKTIELSGIIKFEHNDNWETIKLVQSDGYKIDLVGRFKEAIESFSNCQFNVGYYLSDSVCTKNDIVEGFLKKLFGSAEASFETDSYHYSSMTYGTDYDTNLKIGGHDLFQELRYEQGKFIILELNFIPN